MSSEQEKASPSHAPRSPDKAIELQGEETLTDLFDRMDREAFRRALELRDSRIVVGNVPRR